MSAISGVLRATLIASSCIGVGSCLNIFSFTNEVNGLILVVLSTPVKFPPSSINGPSIGLADRPSLMTSLANILLLI